MANKWPAVWLFVMQLAGLSSAFGQTLVAEGSGSCAILSGLPLTNVNCTTASVQTGPRGTTVSDSASAYAEYGGGYSNVYGTIVYESRYAYGDIGIKFDSTLRTTNARADAHVITEARFVDFVRIQSTTLPVGTPVSLTFSGALDWNGASGITGRQGDSAYQLEFWNMLSVNSNLIFAGVAGNFYGLGALDPNNPPEQTVFLTDPHTTFSGIYDTHIGDTLEVRGGIHGRFLSNTFDGQYTEETIPWSVVSGRIDALGSAHTYITASDSNIQLVALSGHDYAPPVPEPETWAMLLCGLGLLFKFRRTPAGAASNQYALKRLLVHLIVTLAGLTSSLTAQAGIQVSSSACSYGVSTGVVPVADCPSVTKISPELIPNEVVSSESSGRFVVPATPSDPAEANVSLSAASRARADYGSLGIYASVSSTGSSTGAGGVAETTAWATFDDTLTVTSRLLPLGSPVTLRYDFLLNRSVNISESYQTSPTGHASGYLYATLTMSRNGIDGVNQGWCAGDCSNLNLPSLGAVQVASAGIDTFSGQMQLQVGDVVNVFSSLSTISRAILSGITFATPTFGTYSAEVRSFDSAHPYFRIEGQDAFLMASSGHDYTMPVPEPSSWAMLAVGLGVLFAMRRARAKAEPSDC